MILQKEQDPSLEDSASSESNDEQDEEDTEDDLDPEDPTTDLIRSSRQEATERIKADRIAKKKAQKAESSKLAKERKKKQVSLNGNKDVDLSGMTSLSGSKPQQQNGIKCYNCDGPHKIADCPQKRRYSGGDDGPPRKTHKTR